MTNKKRETFQNRFGFVLACIGSAVGMGNIWLFPYRVGEGGGAAFLIPYFIFVFVLGFAGVAGEMAFGRAMKAGSIGAFRGASEDGASSSDLCRHLVRLELQSGIRLLWDGF